MNAKGNAKKYIAIFLLLLPSLIGLFLFNLIPIAYSVEVSLTNWDGIAKNSEFVGLANYLEVFRDKLSMNSFLITLKFILYYLPLVLILGLILALLVFNVKKGGKFYRSILFIPVIMSWIAVSFIWKWFYDPYGLLNYILSLFGKEGLMWLGDERLALLCVVASTVWKDLGFIAFILMAGLENISSTYYEAADIDGASGFDKFLKITLPLLTPSIFFILVFSLINNFQVFDQFYIMTSGGPLNSTRTIVMEIYENAFRFNMMGKATAQSWLLFVIILAITVIQNIIHKRWVVYEAE